MRTILERLIEVFVEDVKENKRYFFIPFDTEFKISNEYNILQFFIDSINERISLNGKTRINSFTVYKTHKVASLFSNSTNKIILLEVDKENIIREDKDLAEVKELEFKGVTSLTNLLIENGNRLDLSGLNLRGAQLQGADLREVNLQNSDLQGANLERANLEGANLQGANLQGCNFKEANLMGADLSYSDFRRTNLSQADLRGTTWNGAALRGVELWAALIQDVDFSGAFTQGVDISRGDTRGSTKGGKI
ncbi:pentapeptide repeat-containing protein [Paenibacillus elgii]|uniref:pentapeptide repeat-containing protein n=1 Tax=Paenibacillus elgii TaxID=189691 RepID=UPI00203FE251|nr:pentapeptide repeat-containing protein [Paenibacillus elgii]MCM3268656.1 pentapeptide repeat-containing protein [Paenibacillus elgii]